MNTPASPPRSVDLFCAVIDNFGDIGVCWRLARQLSREHQLAVRLWVDDLKTFQKLAPTLNVGLPVQFLDSVEIRLWSSSSLDCVEPADLVIEGFGCPLPEHFLDAMARRTSPVRWVNLEYLSAEPWTLDCHLQRSRHPRLPLEQVFFFPGFDSHSGGLVREAELLKARDAFQSDIAAQQSWWESFGQADALHFDRRISVFAYENPAICELLAALQPLPTSSLVLVPEGRALTTINDWAGRELHVGDSWQTGSLTLRVIPFLLPEDYDRLLWACDLNAVRGEDSFVRAHWAGRPMLWHIYPQEENAHHIKLQAWLDMVTPSFPDIWRQAQKRWNGLPDGQSTWEDLLGKLPEIRDQAERMARQLGAETDLATRLMDFCAKQ